MLYTKLVSIVHGVIYQLSYKAKRDLIKGLEREILNWYKLVSKSKYKEYLK